MTPSTPVPQERKLVTELPGPASQALHARKGAAVATGVGVGLPAYVVRAGGGILVDVDGNQLIDFGSGIAVTSVGNSAPRVVANVSEQVADFTHTCFMVTPYEKYVEVCEQLADLTPGDHEKRSALFNSGAEAVENAVKIARTATGRTAVVAFEHGYHGRTNLTMGLTSKNMPYKHGFGPFAPEIYRAPMAYPLRWPGGAEQCADQAFAAFVDVVHSQVGESNTAAVIIEPIQGEGGFVVPPPGWLPRVADYCREHGIVLIADEIQTGFCRTGDWFACDHEGVVPDLITTAKGIAGGLPLAAVTGRAELMDSVHSGGLGGTYGGNPVACAAALGAIATMRAEDLPRARPRHRAALPHPVGAAALEVRRHRRDPRTRRHAGHRADRRRRRPHAEPDGDRRHQQALPQPGFGHPDRGHVRQRVPVPAAAVLPRPPAGGGPRHHRGRFRPGRWAEPDRQPAPS